MSPVIPIPEQLLIVLIVPASVIAATVIVRLLHRCVPGGGTCAPVRSDAADPETAGALRALAARWGARWVSARFARELDEELNLIAACRRPGPDILEADVFGDSIPDLEAAAVAQAQELYGDGARLLVERTDTIETSFRRDKGKFQTRVRVRCLNYYYPEEDA